MSFVKQTGLTLLSKGLLVIISLAYRIILARYLEADGMGIVEPLRTYGMLAVQFGNLGLAVGVIYFIGLDKARAPKLSGTLVTSGLIISAILIAGFYLAGFLFPEFLGNVAFNHYLIILLSIPPLLIALFCQNLLLVYQKIVAFNLIELIIRAAAIGAAIILFLTLDKSDWIISIIWLTVGVSFAMGLFNLIWAWTTVPFSLRFSWTEFRELIGYGWKSYYATFMGFIIGKSDILFMNSFRSENETGIYGQVMYTSDFVYLIPVTIGMLLFPKLMQDGASPDRGLDDRAHLTMLVARIIGTLMIAMWIIFAIIGKWFLGIFGDEFVAGYYPLMIFLGGVIFLGIETILASELARRGLPIFVVIYSTVVLVLKIIANLLLIPKFGMYGAAWSSVVTYIVFLAMVLSFCVKYYGFSLRDTLFLKPGDFHLIKTRLMR